MNSTLSPHPDLSPAALRPAAEAAFNFAGRQVRALVTNHPDYFPLFTKDGRWFHDSEDWINWGDGFLAGLLWLVARRTGEPWWRERAEHYSRLLQPRMHDRGTHDLGFIFLPSWNFWHDLTGGKAQADVVVQAGRTLALRFNEQGRYLRSFIAPESTFVDIMMNVPLIFIAAKLSGDERLAEIADQHCLTTRRHLVRGDGSTLHEGWFNAETGEFLRPTTHQGWRPDSSWTRGLTWAFYGFSQCFELTGDERYLDVAERCARFYMDHTPVGSVPPNDWEEPQSTIPHESSAAAIAAAGLLHLATQTVQPALKAACTQHALATMSTLMTPEYLAISTPGWEGILRGATYHLRKGLGVNESVMWGEYYFVLALDKVLELGTQPT